MQVECLGKRRTNVNQTAEPHLFRSDRRRRLTGLSADYQDGQMTRGACPFLVGDALSRTLSSGHRSGTQPFLERAPAHGGPVLVRSAVGVTARPPLHPRSLLSVAAPPTAPGTKGVVGVELQPVFGRRRFPGHSGVTRTRGRRCPPARYSSSSTNRSRPTNPGVPIPPSSPNTP